MHGVIWRCNKTVTMLHDLKSKRMDVIKGMYMKKSMSAINTKDCMHCLLVKTLAASYQKSLNCTWTRKTQKMNPTWTFLYYRHWVQNLIISGFIKYAMLLIFSYHVFSNNFIFFFISDMLSFFLRVFPQDKVTNLLEVAY